MEDPRQRIVAAVAGDDAHALLQFAAQEAVRTSSELHLVHVMKMPPALPDSYRQAYKTARGFGRLILDRAAREARDLVAGQVSVTHELIEDSRGTVNDLVTCSENARLVVLQHRGLAGVRRLTSGSTTAGVASRAHAPVVSVPESWTASDSPHGRVTVALREPSRSEDTLRAAFEAAHERHDALRVLHTWWLANGYDAVVVDDDMRADWEGRFRNAIAPEVTELQGCYPDVPVEVDVQHAPIEMALAVAADTSDLVVLGRRHPRLPWGSHLGPVARHALRTSTVPVLLVEATHPEPVAGPGTGREIRPGHE